MNCFEMNSSCFIISKCFLHIWVMLNYHRCKGAARGEFGKLCIPELCIDELFLLTKNSIQRAQKMWVFSYMTSYIHPVPVKVV